MNMVANNTSINGNTNTQNNNNEDNAQDDTDDDIETEEETAERKLETDIEAIIDAELNTRGDAFTWSDGTTAMAVLQTGVQFTPLEAAALQSALVDYLKSIGAEINGTASFQNPELASGNKIFATKGEAKYMVGFIGVGPDGAFYIAYAGI